MTTLPLAPFFWVALALVCLVASSSGDQNGRIDIVLTPMKAPVIEYVTLDLYKEERASRREDKGCSLLRPGAAYVCVGGVWTYFNTTVSSGGILEVSSGESDIGGSLYMAPGSVMAVDGLSATLWVEGCARLESTVEVTLSESNVQQLHDNQKNGRSLTFDLMESECNNITAATAKVVSEPEECRVWSVTLGSRALFAGRYMATLRFTSSTARCNYWWIILISILLITPAVIFLMWVVYRLCCRTKQKRRAPTVRINE